MACGQMPDRASDSQRTSNACEANDGVYRELSSKIIVTGTGDMEAVLFSAPGKAPFFH